MAFFGDLENVRQVFIGIRNGSGGAIFVDMSGGRGEE
jgi:hypothetical protein